MGLFTKKIFRLIDAGDTDAIDAYLEKNPNQLEATRNYKSDKRVTPLLYAAITKNYDMAKHLLEKGANVDAQNNYKETALHYAMCYGDEKLIMLLLDHHARTDIKNEWYQIAIECNASTNVKRLIDPYYIPASPKGENKDVFVKESEHIVSFTQVAQASQCTIKTFYNFGNKTVTTQLKDPDGQSCYVQNFNQAADRNQLKEASIFLNENGGQAGSLKLQVIN
tara:strand:+ start:312913 stop:313581 length:669 start_codon:yes stop_codon:yes gene_type:complete